MRAELGADVRTSDGEDVGRIDKLIMDPATGEVKAAVVRKGLLLRQDIEVPVDCMRAGGANEVVLTYAADDLDDLPRFVEENYTASPPTGYVPGYDMPTAVGGLLWPVGYPWPGMPYDTRTVSSPSGSEADEMLRKLDLQNAVIDEGSNVYSRDGHKVGEVHTVVFDTDTRRPLAIVVRKGFLFTQDVELPVSMLASVDDEEVHLNVDKAQVEEQARTRR
jgi:uncharacterized protein YrrD